MGGRGRSLGYAGAVLVAVTVLTSAILLRAGDPAPEATPPTAEPTARTTARTTAEPPATDSLRLLTANIPYSLGPIRAREQLALLLAADADVVVVNEVRDRDVAALSSMMQPGRWTVHQPPEQSQTAVLWRSDRLDLLDQGASLGFVGRGYDRWMLWSTLRDRVTGQRLNVVGLHLPTNSSRIDRMRRYFQTMTDAYLDLIRQLRASGLPTVLGGDWNHPLDKPREEWSPVPMLRSVQMTTNWQQGLPCRGTSPRLGKIDGFAMDTSVRVLAQGCLERRHSDHRPVWMDVALPAARPTGS